MATLNITDLHQQDTSCLREYNKEDRIGSDASKTQRWKEMKLHRL